jgi:hypothetical protein
MHVNKNLSVLKASFNCKIYKTSLNMIFINALDICGERMPWDCQTKNELTAKKCQIH